MSRVHIVKWKTPLGPSVSPYLNRAGLVRLVVYARLQAALDLACRDGHARVLDFGCWDGHFLPSLLNNFGEVWGVDDDSASVLDSAPSYSTILQVARILCEAETECGHRLSLIRARGPELPFPDGYFDVVFCLDTLVHVDESARPGVIGELGRITRSGGQLIFSLPIEKGPVVLLRRLLRALTRKQIDATAKRYDFRQDRDLLRRTFAVSRQQFVPAHFLGELNPTLLLDCRIP